MPREGRKRQAVLFGRGKEKIGAYYPLIITERHPGLPRP